MKRLLLIVSILAATGCKKKLPDAVPPPVPTNQGMQPAWVYQRQANMSLHHINGACVLLYVGTYSSAVTSAMVEVPCPRPEAP